MIPTFIIKNNKIYKVINLTQAEEIKIENGVIKTTQKIIDYKKGEDFLYALFEIKAKFSDLFQPKEEKNDPEELIKEIGNKNKTIDELENKLKSQKNKEK